MINREEIISVSFSSSSLWESDGHYDSDEDLRVFVLLKGVDQNYFVDVEKGRSERKYISKYFVLGSRRTSLRKCHLSQEHQITPRTRLVPGATNHPRSNKSSRELHLHCNAMSSTVLLLLLIARGDGKEPTVCSCKIRI